MKMMETFFKPIVWIATKIEGQYTGRLRGVAQAAFLTGFLILITSPFLIYTALLTWQLQPPYCYISFSLWIAFMVFISFSEIYVGYNQAKRLVESLSKDFTWDLEKYSKEYFEILEAQSAKKKRKIRWF
jgi:hypothetical protein